MGRMVLSNGTGSHAEDDDADGEHTVPNDVHIAAECFAAPLFAAGREGYGRLRGWSAVVTWSVATRGVSWRSGRALGMKQPRGHASPQAHNDHHWTITIGGTTSTATTTTTTTTTATTTTRRYTHCDVRRGGRTACRSAIHRRSSSGCYGGSVQSSADFALLESYKVHSGEHWPSLRVGGSA